MNIDNSKIPDIQIENIGNKNKPLFVLKGFIKLSQWTDYFLYDESYQLIKEKVVTDGRIQLWMSDDITSEESYDISPEQVNSYFYQIEHQQRIKFSILENLKKEFPRLLANEYGSWEQKEPYFPDVSSITPEFDLKKYIGPESIRIHKDAKDKIAYVTWNFRCSWDIEHGFEVITHKDRVIDIALEADIWKIYKDNGTYDQMQKAYHEREWNLPKKKKWWQF